MGAGRGKNKTLALIPRAKIIQCSFYAEETGESEKSE